MFLTCIALIACYCESRLGGMNQSQEIATSLRFSQKLIPFAVHYDTEDLK